MTARAKPDSITVDGLDIVVLRGLFRQYQAWLSLYESGDVEDTIACGSIEVNLWDLMYLVESIGILPNRQRQAIELCFIQNIRETDAATMMGVSPTNPVSVYANDGFRKMLAMMEDGELPRFTIYVRGDGSDG